MLSNRLNRSMLIFWDQNFLNVSNIRKKHNFIPVLCIRVLENGTNVTLIYKKNRLYL